MELRLKIDAKTNALVFNSNYFKFSHKFSPIMFKSLYQKSLLGENLTFDDLESEIKKIKPLFSLRRTQASRMVSEIEHCIQELKLPFKFQYQNRNKTVGPWYLTLNKEINFIFDTPLDTIIPQQTFRSLLDPKTENYSTQLCKFLLQWIKSFYAYDVGLINEALQELMICYTYPITEFTQHFLKLYKARLYAIKGEHKKAENLIKIIIDDAHISHQSHLYSYAQVVLNRIKYQNMPASRFSSLLNKNIKPEKYLQEDPMSLMIWHNLQSLLLKRKLLTLKDHSQRIVLHQQVISHLEEAIIISLILENRNYFLDFCTNYALYLQTVIPLKLSQPNDVAKWYQLTTVYFNKLGVGDYSILGHIFYTEFYLEYQNSIKLSDNDFLSPNKEQYYLDILKKAEEVGNVYQLAVFYLSYFRFAQMHLDREKTAQIANRILLILKDNPELQQELIADNYHPILAGLAQYEDAVSLEMLNLQTM